MNLEALNDTLREATIQLEKCLEREEKFHLEAGRAKLMNKAEAMEYLRRDAVSLWNYWKQGLDFYKKGQFVWYKKGDTDD